MALTDRFFTSIEAIPERLLRGVVSVGNFDGVHRGHARLIERLVAMAWQVDGPSLVMTFHPHPIALLRPEAAPPPLASIQRNAMLALQLGADAVLAYPTDQALLEIEADAFFEDIILGRLHAQGMVEGPNFAFGRGRRGTVQHLQTLCEKARVPLEVVPPYEIDGQIVSSTRIREAVAGGHVAHAADMLGRPHRVTGIVGYGAQRGRTIGYPTANVENYDVVLPANGIYAARACVADNLYAAAVCIGPNPTFDDDRLKVEAHLLDFKGNIYDQPISLDFLVKLRDLVRYDSVDELLDQMGRDVEQTRKLTGR